MKRILRKLPALICGVLCLVAAGSCNHRDLCYDHSHWVDLRICFDWDGVEEADRPATMMVKMFPRNGGETRTYEITDYGGVLIRIPADDYDCVAYGGDYRLLQEQGDTYDEFCVTTSEESMETAFTRIAPSAPRPDGTEDQPIKGLPGKTCSASLTSIHITAASGQTVTLSPTPATVDYTLSIKNAENISDKLEYYAVLSGVAESHSPSLKSPAGRPVTVPLNLGIAGPTELGGKITVFGHCPSPASPSRHILTIYTSNKYYYNYDVTDQIHDAADPRHVEIVIDGIKLPHYGGTGLNPNVSDWSDVLDRNISMN